MNPLLNMKYEGKLLTDEEMLEEIVKADNARVEEYPRTSYQCNKCNNKEVFYFINNGEEECKSCECKKIRNTIINLQNSGIDMNMLEHYTFENYETSEPYQKAIKEKALEYWRDISNGKKTWFVINGQSGSGKTHICTALFQNLVTKKFMSGEYFLWTRDCKAFAKKSKGYGKNQEDFEKWEERLHTCDVLYIDDFLKKTEYDEAFSLAYQIVNERYNSGKITIISSELSYDDITKVDEAIAGRINERTNNQKYWLFITRGANKNYRLKGDKE